MTDQVRFQPLIQQALAVREQVLERLHRGDLVYARDIAALAHELNILSRLNQPAPMARLLTAMGAIELQLGHFSAAYDFVMASLKFYQEAGDQDRTISGYSNLGEVLRLWGKPDEALKHYEKAREMALQTENWEILALIVNNIGMVHLEQREPRAALHLLRQAMEYSERVPRTLSVKNTQGETWGGIARACLELDDYTQAWQAAQRSRQIAEELNRPGDMGLAYRILGIVACQLEASPDQESVDASQYFKRSRELFQASGARAEYARTLVLEARWRLTERDIPLARQQLAEAETLFEELKLTAEALEAHALHEQTALNRTA